ncbi:MAG TPA: TrmH family RNA methyltransferase, partial [bacterium]|nr:TrmH family RNA methyltransferase [bacterium]
YMSEDSKVLWAADFSGNIAFILGSEKQGISKAALELCDEKLWIPTFGLTRSLNVSVAAAVIIYEILRKKRYEYKEETNEIIAPFMKYKGERS